MRSTCDLLSGSAGLLDEGRALVDETREQLLPRGDEGGGAVALELGGERVHVDACLGEAVEVVGIKCARGGDGGEVASGTVVRGAVEMRSVILKRLVRLRDIKSLAPVGLMARLVTSNHLRSE